MKANSLEKKIIVSIVFIALFTQFGFTATVTSKQSGNWSSSSSWNGGSVPASSDSIVINAGNDIVLNSNITITGSLTVNGTLIDPTGGAKRSITVNGGSVFINNTTTIEGTFSMDGSAKLTVATGITLSVNLFTITSTSVATVNGTISSATDIRASDHAIINGSGTVTASAAMTISDSATIFDSTTSCSGGCSKSGTPLPVELLYFSAEPVRKEVNLKWSSASESNNAYYTLEKSQDGEHFQEFAKVDGSGNSSSVRTYEVLDTDPFTGVSYYRLKQTDFNNESKYFNILAVNVSSSEGLSLTIFPSVATSFSQINFQLEGESTSLIHLVIRDVLGKEYFSTIISLEVANQHYSFDTDIKLSSGVYFVTAFSYGNMLSKKIVIE